MISESMTRCLYILSLCWALTTTYAQDIFIDHYETVVFADDTWRYFVADSEPDDNWAGLSFNDSSWEEGAGGFGYGDGDDNTLIAPTTSIYLRIKFSIIDSAVIESVLLQMDYDDAFVAYINGIEVARSGLVGTPPPFDELGINHEAQMWEKGIPETFILDAEPGNSIADGENVLAIQVHNSSVSSSDMTAIAFLTLGLSTSIQSYRPTPSWFVEPTVLSTSNLPIVLIETENRANIPDEPKIKAHMKIIHNGTGEVNRISDPGNIYDGNIGIEIRGAYSASLPQKPYGIETRDAFEENLNVSLLGMPRENDWILLANYNDKVFMRNSLAFHLFREMGHYAPRTEFCEVSLNGSYDGIYLFTEKIKRDKNRVDIAKLDIDDIAGDSLTGGYIFKIDYFSDYDSWTGSFSPVDNKSGEVHYVYSDPKVDELTMEQKNYLKDFVEAFESKLYGSSWKHQELGYTPYIDINSFIDYFIIGELSRNVDAYKKSRFYFKEKDSKGGLIHSGPVWDFDWAWKNLYDGCQIFNATNGSGWAYQIGSCDPWPSPSGWMVRLMQDPYFKQLMANRYRSLRRNILSNTYLESYIDSVHTLLEQAQERHYKRWPTLGINVGAPESGDQPLSYAGEIIKFKDWIRIRLNWLDANMPLEGELPAPFQPEDNSLFKIFPNPVSAYVYVEAEHLIQQVEIFDTQGSLVDIKLAGNVYSYKMNVKNLSPGIFFVTVTFDHGGSKTMKLLVY